MGGRFGLGPVFAAEWTTGSRRWQMYAIRSGYVLLLLIGLSAVAMERIPAGGQLNLKQQAEVGQAFFSVTSILLLALIGLAAPAATAGTVCQEKARGNLQLLFATDLSDSEIILGKLAARLIPVVGLILGTLPVLALGTLMGGVDPVDVTGTFLVLLALAVFGCALALALSVWGTRMQEVLFATYALGIGWSVLAIVPEIMRPLVGSPYGLIGSPIHKWLLMTNPVYLIVPESKIARGAFPQVTLATQAGFLMMAVVVSALLVGLSIARVRRVAIRQMGRGEGTRRSGRLGRYFGARAGRFGEAFRRLPGPSLDGNPVLWREWHRSRPTRWGMVLWGGFAVVTVVAGAAALAASVGNRASNDMAAVISGLLATASLLLLCIPAATSLAEERQRGSLDVLLATPLETRTILWGKWWGAFRGALIVSIVPALVAYGLSLSHRGFPFAPLLVPGYILSFAAMLASLGLLLAIRLPRMGAAVGVTTAAFIGISLSGLLAVFLERGGRGDIAEGMAASCPFWGVGYYSALIGETGGPQTRFESQTLWMMAWVAILTAASAGLFSAAVWSVGRCLGRIEPGRVGPTLAVVPARKESVYEG
jgi:ABC-type transport system involved in multi-copper enzyme maturation permease subunit